MNPSTGLAVDWNMDAVDWAHALTACPDTTYFHTNGWLNAVSRCFGTRLIRLGATLPDGTQALLPLSIRPLARGWLPVALAGETGAYNGLVAPRPLTPVEAEAVYAAVRTRYPDLLLTGNPFASGAHMPGPAAGGQSEWQSTHLLALKPFEELRSAFSRGCKARGNKAKKQGLTLVVSNDVAAARPFYDLYLDSIRRWGDKLTWARPLAFFEDLVAEGAPHVNFFLAYREGAAISGLLMASYGSRVHYIAGATHADHLERCPSNFLMEAALAHYASEGFAEFDFGPSNGLAGVVQFKESFGAHAAPFMSQRLASPGGALYFTLRSARESARRVASRALDTVLPRRWAPSGLP